MARRNSTVPLTARWIDIGCGRIFGPKVSLDVEKQNSPFRRLHVVLSVCLGSLHVNFCIIMGSN
jgi:hypothetical protein